MKISIFLSLTLLSCTLTFSQSSGWDLILDNRFEDARSQFEAEIKADSSNESSLLGGIFLADIYSDEERYERLVNKLYEHSEDPLVWYVFLQDLSDKFVDKKADPIPFFESEQGKLIKKSLTFLEEKEAESQKDYEKACEIFDPLFQNKGWAFLGPFKNIVGHAHTETFLPEKQRSADLSATYDNGLGLNIKWIKPTFHNPIGDITVEDYLPGHQLDETYFAHKAFSLEKAESFRLNLARSAPVKLWIDGQLVYEEADPRTLQIDGEQFDLRLGAGRHDILVKLSEFSAWKSNSSDFRFRGTYDYNAARRGVAFNLHLTTPEGRPFDLDLGVKEKQEGKLLSFKKRNTQLASPVFPEGEEAQVKEWDYYLWARYFLRSGTSREVEQYFVDLEQLYDTTAYFDILLAAIYDRNGNKAMAFKTLSRIDLDQTPFYPLLRKRLNEVDPKVDKDSYEKRLERLRDIAPSNKNMLRQYLRYYNSKDDSAHLATVKEETLDVYPQLEYIFEQYSITASEDKKKKKKNRNRNKSLSTRKKIKQAEDRLGAEPYELSSYTALAKLYKEEKKYEEALQIIDKGMALSPYFSALHSQKGDVFKEMSQHDSALHYYRMAKKLDKFLSSGGSYYRSQDLDQKIENLSEEKESLWQHFKSQKLEEILAKEDEWSQTYAEEDALVLMHVSDYWMKENGAAEIKRSFALKMLNENGVDPWIEENFSYLGRSVSVVVRKPDGSEVQPEMRGTHAVFKNLEPGDIILAEGSFNINSYKGEGESYGFQDYFRVKGGMMFIHPIYYQKFEVAFPQGTALHYHSVNTPVEVESFQAGNHDFYKWEWLHTPKLIEEEAAYSKWAASPEIFLVSDHDWSIFSDWYEKLTYRKLEPNYALKKLYDQIIEEGMSQEEKLIRIYNYITQEISYSSVSFLQSSFIPQEPQLTCSAAIGDCKDVATLMITLLRMAGIESHYVLVKAGRYLPYKSLTANIFNHAIVAYEMEGQTHFLDLTTDKYPYYVLPEQDHEAWALMIKPGEQDLFRLPNDQLNPQKNLVSYQLDASFDDQDRLRLKVKGSYKGIEGGRIREYLSSSRGKNVQAFIQEELNLSFLPGNQILDRSILPLDQIDQPLELNLELLAEDFGEQLYGLYIFPLPLLEKLEIPNEFLPRKRNTVMDLNMVFNLSPKKEFLNIEIPEDYELFSLPKDVEKENEFGRYEMSFKKEGNILRVYKTHKFFKSKIFPEEYETFRDFYFQIAKLDAMKVVLVKKGFRYPRASQGK